MFLYPMLNTEKMGKEQDIAWKTVSTPLDLDFSI